MVFKHGKVSVSETFPSNMRIRLLIKAENGIIEENEV